ncbi:hypothetical protein I4U23_014459 [Adineta vaga]|nr:hypothetical protein I4U23_014459 [Adineta vaga]
MPDIKVYPNGYGIDKEYHKVPIHYQFHFYYFVPYVLISDLKNIDVRAEGLFIQDENFESHTLSRYPDRIYLRSIHSIPIEPANYILNISDCLIEKIHWTKTEKVSVMALVVSILTPIWTIFQAIYSEMIKKI